jgi:hypothetical protein
MLSKRNRRLLCMLSKDSKLIRGRHYEMEYNVDRGDQRPSRLRKSVMVSAFPFPKLAKGLDDSTDKWCNL